MLDTFRPLTLIEQNSGSSFWKLSETYLKICNFLNEKKANFAIFKEMFISGACSHWIPIDLDPGAVPIKLPDFQKCFCTLAFVPYGKFKNAPYYFTLL